MVVLYLDLIIDSGVLFGMGTYGLSLLFIEGILFGFSYHSPFFNCSGCRIVHQTIKSILNFVKPRLEGDPFFERNFFQITLYVLGNIIIISIGDTGK